MVNLLALNIYNQINTDFDKMTNAFNVTAYGTVYLYTISSIVSNLTNFTYDGESNYGKAKTVLTSNVTLSSGHISLTEDVKFIVILILI
jgi:hypothetical protein